jgi:lipid-A-disaccharide synthase
MLIRVKHISLVNLILGRECVKELIQSKFTSENLNIALRDILDNESSRLEILSGYRELRQKLGEQDAYARAAALLCAAAGRS